MFVFHSHFIHFLFFCTFQPVEFSSHSIGFMSSFHRFHVLIP